MRVSAAWFIVWYWLGSRREYTPGSVFRAHDVADSRRNRCAIRTGGWLPAETTVRSMVQASAHKYVGIWSWAGRRVLVSPRRD